MYTFNQTNCNWVETSEHNLLFLKMCESHLNTLLQRQGHVLLNDVFDQIGAPRTYDGAIGGWVYGTEDGYIEFGYSETSDGAIHLDFNHREQILEDAFPN